MSFISQRPQTKLNGFKLNLAFDIVLDIYQLFEEDITEVDKINTALYMLIRNKRKLNKLDIQQRDKLLKQIFEECINPKSKPTKKQEKTVDFNQDAEYIYSSFMADYGIDLINMRGKLHWKKFISLFQGLSDKTIIKQVISIRSRPLPKPTKYNTEERQNLIELKSYYSLKANESDLQDGLQQLFCTLERMAK